MFVILVTCPIQVWSGALWHAEIKCDMMSTLNILAQNMLTHWSWDKFCKQNLKMLLYVNFCMLIQIAVDFFSKGSIDNMAALVQITDWHGTGGKPLSQAIMVRFTGTYTVETLYNTINFCWSTHKRHSIARPKGRGMGCLLWVQRATYCVDLSILSSMKYFL